jgi:hypothetical protein
LSAWCAPAWAHALALCAACSATHAAPLAPHRDSALIRSILSAPASNAIEELLLQRELLAMAGEPEKARAVEDLAERTLLRRILRLPESPSGSLSAAVAAPVPPTELAELRTRTLAQAISYVSPPAGQPADASRPQTFRNETALPILAFRAELDLPAPAPALVCNHDRVLEAGATATIPCTIAGNSRHYDYKGHSLKAWSLQFAPGSYQLTSAGPGVFEPLREAAMTRLGSTPRADLVPPAPVPTQGVPFVQYSDAQPFAMVTPLLCGWLLGVVIARRAKRPDTTATKVSAGFALLMFFAVAVFMAWMALPRNLGNVGNLEGQVGLLLLMGAGIGAVFVAAVLWTLLVLGLWLGIVTGYVSKRIQ